MTEPGFTDETLMAFADGELDAAEAARVEAAMEQDPALYRRVEAFKTTRRLVSETLGPLAELPLPPSLERTVASTDTTSPTSNVVPLPAQRARPTVARWALPLAASLALMIGGGGGYWLGQAGRVDQALVASNIGPELRQALTEQPTGAARSIAGAGAVRMIATFRNGVGELCREWVSDEPTRSVTAIACRDANGWSLQLAVAGAPTGDAGFTTATGLAVVEAYLAEIDAGPTLSPEAEAEALRVAP